MSDNNNNNNNDLNNIRTDSYLPLLFANGYPTSLEKMSREALELFIPFLVRCARYGGNENSDSTPVWWPGTVEFKTPLEKPKHYKKVLFVFTSGREIFLYAVVFIKNDSFYRTGKMSFAESWRNVTSIISNRSFSSTLVISASMNRLICDM